MILVSASSTKASISSVALITVRVQRVHGLSSGPRQIVVGANDGNAARVEHAGEIGRHGVSFRVRTLL